MLGDLVPGPGGSIPWVGVLTRNTGAYNGILLLGFMIQVMQHWITSQPQEGRSAEL